MLEVRFAVEPYQGLHVVGVAQHAAAAGVPIEVVDGAIRIQGGDRGWRYTPNKGLVSGTSVVNQPNSGNMYPPLEPPSSS